MSCKCKNIIENWQGGTVPLSTTFLSPVQFNSLVTLLMSCQKPNGTSLLTDMLTMGAHPSPITDTSTYCIMENTQVIHADGYTIDGTLNLDGELVFITT